MPLFSRTRRLVQRPTTPQAQDHNLATDRQSDRPEHPLGRIDIHCHLIPGVDDGCQTTEQALECIQRLIAIGYTGSICTPHIWPDLFPDNNMPNIRKWTTTLQKHVRNAGLDYQLWPGAELRLFDGVIDWLENNEVPTLAHTRFVLVDFWEEHWHEWVDAAFNWLIEHDYQPILAHPERLAVPDLPERLDTLTQRGAFLQGNFRCITGEDGFMADQWVRQFLFEGRYHFMAMDVHRPDTLEARILGLNATRAEFGPHLIDPMTLEAPRQTILALEN